MLLDGTALPESGSRPRAAARHAAASLIFGPAATSARLSALLEVWAGALCAQVDGDLFFPEKGQPTRAAKAVCAACPVRTACLSAFGDLPHGVVAGLSVAERRTHRRGEVAA
jgi:WhiB family transcriptional regulator, redox-sensing transcriptional regulator